jgi:hypothetical protein
MMLGAAGLRKTMAAWPTGDQETIQKALIRLDRL